MAKIAFILLCHKDPEAVIQQARQLTAVGDYIAIHFDAAANAGSYATIHAALADNPNVAFARKRIRCGWGEWSLVEATLQAIRAAVDAFPEATHFYMVSGDCMSIKSGRYLKRFVDQDNSDHIESVDFFESDWIKTGIKQERLIYRHFFNERTQKTRFYASMKLQQKLGLTRCIPKDLRVMIGSQWWCLRRRTIETMLDFIAERRDVIRFFRRTWIPDETFFQTLVRHLIPKTEIRSRPLTFLVFSDYGMPATFYNDHYDFLLGQDYMFARKISPEATLLKSRLGQLYASNRDDFEISDAGRKLFAFLTGRGRIGTRYAPRFWERESSLGRERELLIVTCKKWHVAKRLIGAIRRQTGITAIDFLFDEESTPLPDLGGIQTTLAKRTRHRRALIRMLFDYHSTDRMLICLDTANLELIQDFYGDHATTRLLEIDCTVSDDYLQGHAQRIGLVGAGTSAAALAQLLPALRNDVFHEADRIRDANFPFCGRLREGGTVEGNAAVLAAFLSVSQDDAQTIAQTPYLFCD